MNARTLRCIGADDRFRIAYRECGIETFQSSAVYGITLRAWLPNQLVLGLWSNEYDATSMPTPNSEDGSNWTPAWP